MTIQPRSVGEPLDAWSRLSVLTPWRSCMMPANNAVSQYTTDGVYKNCVPKGQAAIIQSVSSKNLRASFMKE